MMDNVQEIINYVNILSSQSCNGFIMISTMKFGQMSHLLNMVVNQMLRTTKNFSAK